MKTVKSVILLFLLLAVISCKEEEEDTKIWGRMGCNKCSERSVQGVLAQGGGDYYGYCRKSGDTFSFMIGDGPANQADWYFLINEINGSPEKGVFTESDPEIPKDGPHESFVKGTIKDTYVYSIDESNFDSTDCYVELYATPVSGELTPEIYGKNTFSYFVSIVCNGIIGVTGGSGALTGFTLDLYFANCS